MPRYLIDVPLPAAWERFNRMLENAGLFGILGKEEILLDENAVDRVLAEPVWAISSSPHYHASAMDGFALRSNDTESASLNTPVVLECVRGQVSDNGKGKCIYRDTGDALPEWADAVVMIENVETLDGEGNITGDLKKSATIRIRAAVPPWQNIRPIGEDLVVTQLVLPAGHVLRPVDLGAIAASGHSSVIVARKPLVAILPTGDELVPVGRPPEKGEIIEYNSIILAAQVNGWGGQATRLPIVLDDFDAIREMVTRAAQEYDLILVNAGSSAGSEDYTAEVIKSCGEVLVHGIAVRPGHPVILGVVRRDAKLAKDGVNISKGSLVPVIGVPGYPVSASLTGEIFVEPLLARWTGRSPGKKEEIQATITRKVTSPAGDDDYLRVVVGEVGGRLLAAPLSRGAGVISSLVRADGIAIIPSGSQGVAAGDTVRVRLYRRLDEIKRTIFAIGSHDVGLDLLTQYLAQYERRLVSANVGSLGGLIALKRGEAHLAGTHLLDPQTGVYNQSYIHQYLAGMKCYLVAFVTRSQGLLVQKGNPKNIRSILDLARPDIMYINRQRGAGTRVLLDYHLSQAGIPVDEVKGYHREEYTHLAVAAAIAGGRADTGLGIAAAAEGLNLSFIPLYEEDYDLAIPEDYYQDSLLTPLFDILNDTKFQSAIASMPGYDSKRMGCVVAEIG